MNSPYLNPDGTFKGGFEGCVLHMTKVEGHSQESAKAICGKIAQDKLRNRSGAAVLSGDFKHPTDGWYQIEVPGEHPNAEAGVIQVIDQAAVSQIVNRFNGEADRYEAEHGAGNYPGMLIDIEHRKLEPTGESRAYGWLMRLENRDGKPFGQIRWTRTGKEAVDGGDYRYFSTEYDPPDLQIVNSKGKVPRVRPLRLSGLSLTNVPNNRGAAPITNQFRQGASAPAADTQNQNPKPSMKSIATKLGLAAEASEDAILAEVTKIQNRVTELEKEQTPIKNRVTELETQNAELLDGQIHAELDAHGITEEARRTALIPVLKPMKNREARGSFLKTVVGDAKPAAGGNKPITNRAGARTPDKAAQGGGSQTPVTPQSLRGEVRKICNRDGLTGPTAFDIGFNRLREERPDLFENGETAAN